MCVPSGISAQTVLPVLLRVLLVIILALWASQLASFVLQGTFVCLELGIIVHQFALKDIFALKEHGSLHKMHALLVLSPTRPGLQLKHHAHQHQLGGIHWGQEILHQQANVHKGIFAAALHPAPPLSVTAPLLHGKVV